MPSVLESILLGSFAWSGVANPPSVCIEHGINSLVGPVPMDSMTFNVYIF